MAVIGTIMATEDEEEEEEGEEEEEVMGRVGDRAVLHMATDNNGCRQRQSRAQKVAVAVTVATQAMVKLFAIDRERRLKQKS